jgi:endonuclease YncB( thermonuclease family)
MQKLISNLLYSALGLFAFGFAAYAPTFSDNATEGATPQLYSPGDEIYGYVIGVMDGDALILRTEDHKELRIRLSSIDAPEKEQAFGEAAKRSLSDLAYNKPAGVRVSGTDPTGRIIGRVFIGTLDLNLAQVGRGLAWVDLASTTDDRLTQLEARARGGRVGLWNEKDPIAPWEYRRREG